MSDQVGDDNVALLNADIDAYMATLTPNEALCMARRLCSATSTALRSAPLMFAPTLSLVDVEVGLVDRLIRASVGSTEDHAVGDCQCEMGNLFFQQVVNRVHAMQHGHQHGPECGGGGA